MTEPVVIQSMPGIKRDGTPFEGEFYTDGQWCRFNRGKPRKIGGYRRISDQIHATVRGMHAISSGGNTYVHLGTSDRLEQLAIDNSTGVATGSLFDRTPAGFAANADYTWQMDVMYNATTTSTSLIAHATSNLVDIDSDTSHPIYYGVSSTGAALAALGMSVCGGVCVLHPHLFVFCQGGLIKWSLANDPTNTGAYIEARVASTKIVRGLSLRAGPGNAPAGLFWSLNSLIRAVYVGGTPVFQFDDIGKCTVLSSHSIIEYDGVYYWIGKGRFFMFNGTVQEMPNELNRTWFFKELNTAHRQKVYAMIVPEWGEIWWCFPRGASTECNHAIIYNTRLKTWYDTELPGTMRSYGVLTDVYGYPVMVDASPISGKSKLWVHESEWDEVDGVTTSPINSYFDTSDMSLTVGSGGNKGVNKSLHCDIVEPDFVQTGEMYAQALGRMNARSKNVEGPIRTFPAIATTPAQQIVKFKETRRQFRFRFGSNTVGGSYEMGQVLGHLAPSDGRTTGGVVS